MFTGLIGTALNALAVLVGGLLGLLVKRPPAASTQHFVKLLLAVSITWVGLSMTWMNLGGGFWAVVRQILIAVLAMTVGRLLGRLLHLQKQMNRLGRYARERFTDNTSAEGCKPGEGFLTCTILYCATPVSVLGAFFDGLDGRWPTLALKAVMDGFSSQAFSQRFGWSPLLAVVPLVASQGTIALLARLAAPVLRDHGLLESVGATGGLLIFCIALLMLDVRKIELADYLPSLAVAPLLTWLCR